MSNSIIAKLNGIQAKRARASMRVPVTRAAKQRLNSLVRAKVARSWTAIPTVSPIAPKRLLNRATGVWQP